MQTENKPKELDVLNYIDQHEDATQRELSEHIGLSLGTVNILLKRMVKKGLVKIERLQPNSVKYFLTPAGLLDKLERTYGYVLRTYTEIDHLRTRIVYATNLISKHYSSDQLVFYGPRDDFSKMVEDICKAKGFSVLVQVLHQAKELQKQTTANPSAPVIIWKEESQEMVEKLGLQWVNIMGKMVV